MNDTLKWMALAVVGYLLWNEFSSSDLASTVGTTPTTPATGTTGTTATPTAAQVTLASGVTQVANNALQATFNINGQNTTIAVIPNGGAYNTAGQDISTQLAGMGISPNQLYQTMYAAYTPTTDAATGRPSSTTGTGIVGNTRPGVAVGPAPIVKPIEHVTTSGVRGINALAAGLPVVALRPQGGKWVM